MYTTFMREYRMKDRLDEGLLALGSLLEYHEGDHDIEAWLKDISDALVYAHDLEKCIRDIDAWVKSNEGMHIAEYVDFDTNINSTKSYMILKSLTEVNGYGKSVQNDERSKPSDVLSITDAREAP